MEHELQTERHHRTDRLNTEEVGNDRNLHQGLEPKAVGEVPTQPGAHRQKKAPGVELRVSAVVVSGGVASVEPDAQSQCVNETVTGIEAKQACRPKAVTVGVGGPVAPG